MKVRHVPILFVLLARASSAQDMHMHSDEGKAALLPGFGKVHHKISTRSAQAQRFFDQGLSLMYGFNHEEAVRSFRKAAELDPQCAMAWWGIGLALGPNINDPELDAAREKTAFDAARKALDLSRNATAQEQAYIQALNRRYSIEPNADLKKAAAAYSDAMRELMKAYPDDLDAATLFAESAMDLRPWQLWQPDGTPAEGTVEIVSTLESVLQRDPRHLGANHFYIHATEASRNPEKARASAERLKTLAPASGHLVHMPAHVFIRTGDYHAASRANEVAAEADRAYIRKTGATGMYPSMYYSHNLHFLAVSCSMEGRFADAKKAADEVFSRAASGVKDIAMLEWFMPTPALVLVRFGKWDDILALRAADPGLHLHTAFWRFARGMAFTGKNQLDAAQDELTAMRKVIEQIPADAPFGFSGAHPVLKVAERLLTGKLAAARGNVAEAAGALREAAAGEDALSYDEPPDWHIPTREALGAQLLRAGDAAGAEAVFREELARHPNSGRALWGLSRALSAEGKNAESARMQKQFEQAWKYADVRLRMEEM